jgi:hypothetical protein
VSQSTQADEVIPTLTHATERDIDLLLVEELIASPTFTRWIANAAGWNGVIQSWRVLHSKRRTRSRREIDIFVEIRSDENSKPCVLLIENKLTEEEQPDQAESYREELARIGEECSYAAMLLVCPTSYAANHDQFSEKFDAVVTYEEVAALLRTRMKSADPDLKRRLQFRADLLDQAIHKNRRGYSPILNEGIGSFNENYVRLLSRVAPEIRPGRSMLGEPRPDESVSMIYDHAASLSFLPDRVRPRRFSHELGRNKDHRANYVAVTFAGWGTAMSRLMDQMKADTLGTGFQFSSKPPTSKRPNPGLVMSLATPPADNQGSFLSEEPKLIEGIRAAQQLREWLRANQSKLEAWRVEVS